MIIKICKNCNKEFSKKPSDSRRYWEERKFCSSRCFGIYTKPATKLVGTKRPKIVIEKLKRTMFKKGHESWNKGMKGYNSGEKSHLWKGGVTKSPYYVSHRNKKRRALKFGNGGSHTIGEWETLKAQYNWYCLMCKKQEPEIKLTEDHIIPLSKGGSDNIENIQPLCRSCNSKKRVTIINYRLVEK